MFNLKNKIMAKKKYTAEEDPLGAFTSGVGNSDASLKVYYKRLRGEKLSREEEKLWRKEWGTVVDEGPEIYDTAPF